MRFTKIILILILFITRLNLLYSQSLLKQVLPPSPNASSLGKFAAFPVNLYNGVPQIDIPIWTIEQFGMKVPISLSYHAGGVQVAEVPSCVGTGWALNAGGVITRSVQGLPDDGNAGWIINPLANLPECTGTLGTGDAAYNYFEAATRESNDTESDMYYFNFCGRSGKFVFDKSGNVHTVPYQKIKIKKNPTNPTATGIAISDWEVTIEDGTVFYFNVMEHMQTVTNSTGFDVVASNTSYVGSWYLKEIRSPGTNQKISFEYTSSRYEYDMPASETIYDRDPASVSFCFNHGSIAMNRVVIEDAQKISKITFPAGSIEFVAGAYRHDLKGGQVLDKIIVKNTTNTIKSYSLLYNYFSSGLLEFANLPVAGPTTTATTSYRLSLKGIQELSGNNALGQSYEFTYENSVWLPDRVTSKAVDHWGYYNGQTGNTTLIPSYINYSGTYVVGGFRQTIEPYSQAGVLKQIKYPTGGTTSFEYESNETNNTGYWNESQKVNYLAGGGLCQSTPGQVFELAYPATFKLTFTGSKWPVAVSSSCTNQPFNPQQPSTYVYFNVFNVNDPANPVNMNVAGSTATMTIGYASANYTTTITLPAGKYQIQRRVGSPTGPLLQTGINVDGMYSLNLEGEVVISKQTKKVGGLRIKEMTDYDPISNKSITKTYKYNIDDTTSSGKINFIPTYSYLYKECQVCANPTGGNNVLNVNYTVYSSSSYAPLTAMQDGNVGYDKVIVYYGKDDSGNIGTNGKSEYYYNTRQDFSFQSSKITLGAPQSVCYNPGKIGQIRQYPFAQPVSVDWARGQLLQEINYKNVNGSFVKTDETFNTWKDDYQGFWDTYNPAFDVLGAKVDWDLRVTQTLFSTPSPALAVQYYFIPSRYIKLTKTEKRTYDMSGSNYLSMINEFQYNDASGDLQLKTETSVDSKGDAVRKEYKYPGDYSSIPVFANMKAANILYPVIEETTYRRDILTKGTKNNYTQTGNLFVPESSELKIGDVLASKFNFLRYDSSGNLLEQQKSDGIFFSYIYDYAGVHIISAAINAHYNDIAYTSFESDGKGNWGFSGISIQDGTSPTGSKCYNLSDGNLTKSGLTTTMGYSVSYWTKNSVPFNITGTKNGYPIKGETINGWTYYEHRVTGQSTITISGTGFIDEVRTYPENAQMTTYTWNPLIGIAQQCDVSNQITYYEYDGLGRLTLIRDKNRNILKRYAYAYRQPVETTSLP